MKQANYGFRMSTVFLLIILSIGVIFANAVGQKKYSIIAIEEARRLVRKIVENQEVPPPPSFGYSWKLIGDFHARGAKINDNDYTVFAAVGPVVPLYVPTGNLSEFLPKIEQLDQLMMDVGGKKFKTLRFSLNGVLFSTVDLQIINKPVFSHSGDGRWIKGEQVIKKGGYNWFLGEAGILLSQHGLSGAASDKIIAFEEPVKSRDPKGVYLVNILAGESTGISLEVAGQTIQLK